MAPSPYATFEARDIDAVLLHLDVQRVEADRRADDLGDSIRDLEQERDDAVPRRPVLPVAAARPRARPARDFVT